MDHSTGGINVKRTAIVIALLLLMPWLGAGSSAEENPPQAVDASTLDTWDDADPRKASLDYPPIVLHEQDFEDGLGTPGRVSTRRAPVTSRTPS